MHYIVCQVSLSMGFSRQEYWHGLPFLPPGDLPDPGVKPASLSSPALAASSLPLVPPGKPLEEGHYPYIMHLKSSDSKGSFLLCNELFLISVIFLWWSFCFCSGDYWDHDIKLTKCTLFIWPEVGTTWDYYLVYAWNVTINSALCCISRINSFKPLFYVLFYCTFFFVFPFPVFHFYSLRVSPLKIWWMHIGSTH